MPSVFLRFLMNALTAVVTSGLPTDEQTITLETDDAEKLGLMNISSLLTTMNTTQSLSLSYDEARLKPADIYFHYSELAFGNNTASKLALADFEDPRDGCLGSQCWVDRSLQWLDHDVQGAVAGAACTFIGGQATESLPYGARVAVWYANAVCQHANKGDRVPCNLVGGAQIRATPANGGLPAFNALLSTCNFAMNEIANECGLFGGRHLCVTSMNYDDADIIHYYISPHGINYKPPCSGPGNLVSNLMCTRIQCHKETGACQ